MKKIKRELKKIKDFFLGLRISTIYKLVGIILLIGILFWVFTTVNKSENIEETQTITLTGIIKSKGKNYILIEDTNNKEYVISGINEDLYTIGSEIETIVGSIIDNGTEEKPTTIQSSEITIINENSENKNADSIILAYFTETENYFTEPSLLEEVKMRFITIIDFLFYDGKIKGYKLTDITTKTKLEILKITLSIDSKVETYLPGYKEMLATTGSNVYAGIKNKIIETYLRTTVKICNYDKNLCELATIDFQEMKEAFSISWNVIRNLITDGTENIKEWYEVFSGKKE